MDHTDPDAGPVVEPRPEGAPCSVDRSWEEAPTVIGERPPADVLRERYCREEDEGSGALPAAAPPR
jgi:hypothetical protein